MPECRALSQIGKVQLRIPSCLDEIKQVLLTRLKISIG